MTTQMWKSTIVIWTDYDPSEVGEDIVDLANNAFERGNNAAVCTRYRTELIADPTADPDYVIAIDQESHTITVNPPWFPMGPDEGDVEDEWELIADPTADPDYEGEWEEEDEPDDDNLGLFYRNWWDEIKGLAEAATESAGSLSELGNLRALRQYIDAIDMIPIEEEETDPWAAE